MYASPESIAETRARVPLLRVQRFQREQLHVLIDKAEEAGAWLYSRSQRPNRPMASYERLTPSTVLHEAADKFIGPIRHWYSPSRLREHLKSDYHPEDFYGFQWSVRDPQVFLREMQFHLSKINEAVIAFGQEILISKNKQPEL